jgi:hydroxypyruvate reductase
MDTAAAMRSAARDIFAHALAECSIIRAFDTHLECERGVLRVREDLYDLSSYYATFVVAFGKAAHAMVEALAAKAGPTIVGIVAAPTQPSSQLPTFRYFLGGHPLPNDESLRAGDAVLRSLDRLGERHLAVFLVSGGGSSILEKPIDDEISLPDLVATYRVLVHCGAPIAQINALRKHLSAIKGGRLARAAAPAHQVSMFISDVPDSAPDSLASGPTMPDSTTVEDCYAVVEKYGLLPQFPASVRELFERRALEETPKRLDPAFAHSRWWTLLSNETAVKAAAQQAASLGFAVEVDNRCDDWDYAAAADHLLSRLRQLRQGASRVCLISGGEVTVKVTGNAGLGGRNQQFALYAAQQIAGEQVTVLSAGTDGIDGNSTAAGAVADGTTVARGHDRGLDAAGALRRFDAYPFFDALGDAVFTGPTGNNVRDLRVLLAW